MAVPPVGTSENPYEADGGRCQNEDLGIGAVGGIDRRAIPKADFGGGSRRQETTMKGSNPRLAISKNKKRLQESTCGICEKEVKSSHNRLQCDLCDWWFHCGCEKLSAEDY